MGSLQDLLNRKENADTSLRPKNTKKGFNSLFNNDSTDVDPKILQRLNTISQIDEVVVETKTNIIPLSKEENKNSEIKIQKDTSHLQATSELKEASHLKATPKTQATSKLTASYNFEGAKDLNNYLLFKNKTFYDLTKGQYKLLEFIFDVLGKSEKGSFISKSDFLKAGFNNGRLNNELKGLREMGLIGFEIKFNPENKQNTNFYEIK